MADYFPFHPNPRTPHTKAPPGTIDSQFHVLGPADRYPVRPGAAYQMPTATFAAARRMHQAMGIERGIIVQTTTYGADHSVVIDALAEAGPGYKACANALVFAEADDAALARLHEAGVRGARFSFRQALGAVLSRSDFDRAIVVRRRFKAHRADNDAVSGMNDHAVPPAIARMASYAGQGGGQHQVTDGVVREPGSKRCPHDGFQR